MLLHLKKALDDKGITIRAFAKVLGVDERTIQNKIKGKTPFTYPEAVLSKKELFPEYDLEYLLKKNSKKLTGVLSYQFLPKFVYLMCFAD